VLNSFTSWSVKAIMPRRSAAAALRELREQRLRPGIARRGDQFGQRGRVAQSEVEALGGHRVQRLRGVTDQRHALGAQLPARTSDSG
jgi:hypothetical protein